MEKLIVTAANVGPACEIYIVVSVVVMQLIQQTQQILHHIMSWHCQQFEGLQLRPGICIPYTHAMLQCFGPGADVFS